MTFALAVACVALAAYVVRLRLRARDQRDAATWQAITHDEETRHLVAEVFRLDAANCGLRADNARLRSQRRGLAS